jgi:conjugal transfer pilus assembly protein TraB
VETNETKNVVQRQWLNLFTLFVLVLLLILGIYYLMSDRSEPVSAKINEKTHFANPLTHVDAESVVLESTQKQLQMTETKTSNLQNQFNTANKTSADLSGRIAALEKEVAEKQKIAETKAASNEEIANPDEIQGGVGSRKAGRNLIGSFGIREDVVNLTPSEMDLENRSPLKNPDTYVPAGSFVEAVMLAGSDAPAAVMSQANPETVIFRITANGTLPNQKNSHLKGCFVVASVVGDISSERGRIKAESISCTFKSNEIVDQDITGWVYGNDGKFGVRGRPVWKDGALVGRAFIAGGLSGLSDGLSSTYTTNSISPQGSVQTLNPANFLQYGAAKGGSKAMDKYADYNIQRAEQYHPVIQISAGSVVDIVFVKGFFLDGKKHENKSNAIGNYGVSDGDSPNIFSPSNSEISALPLSPEMVKRIQEKSKELGLQVTEAPGQL